VTTTELIEHMALNIQQIYTIQHTTSIYIFIYPTLVACRFIHFLYRCIAIQLLDLARQDILTFINDVKFPGLGSECMCTPITCVLFFVNIFSNEINLI